MSRRKEKTRKRLEMARAQRVDAERPEPPRRSEATYLRVAIERVELARGWDGPLGGGIEPCLILGAFEVSTGEPSLVGRGLKRMGTVRSFPHIQTTPDLVLEVAGMTSWRIALLCMVLEEDRGRDIVDLFGQIGVLDRFLGYEGHAPVPEPTSLTRMLVEAPSDPPRSRAIHLLRDGAPLEDQVKADNWMAASLIGLQARGVGASSRWRIEARSEDRRNDWIVWLSVDLRV